MKLLPVQIAVPLLCLFGFLTGCSNADSAKASSNTKIAASGESASGSAEASFSITIDGIKITGMGIDAMQIRNTAFIYPDDKGGKKLLISLYSSKNDDDYAADNYLKITAPDQTGTFTYAHGKNDNNMQIMLDMHVHAGSLARYFGNPFTITITSLTSERVKGTFSGSFAVGSDTPRAEKKQVTVTDASFDIPFSTGKVRPE